MLKFHPYSILTGDTMVGFVIFDVLSEITKKINVFLFFRTALEVAHRGWGQSCVIGVAAAGKEISTR